MPYMTIHGAYGAHKLEIFRSLNPQESPSMGPESKTSSAEAGRIYGWFNDSTAPISWLILDAKVNCSPFSPFHCVCQISNSRCPIKGPMSHVVSWESKGPQTTLKFPWSLLGCGTKSRLVPGHLDLRVEAGGIVYLCDCGSNQFLHLWNWYILNVAPGKILVASEGFIEIP